MATHDELGPPIYWHDAEPGRLKRDLADVTKFAPDLAFTAGPGATPDGVHHGMWSGRLPIWPFDRPEPPGLTDLIDGGLTCEVYYAAAHPMVPPRVYPIAPEPEVIERSQHTWHVAPDGSLCLMQTLGDWDPATSVVELLEKACGWRIEYALMKAGAIETMTLSGIVSDASLDGLIGRAKGLASAPHTPATPSDPQAQVEEREVRR
jgi:hypothetical protein